ncbi:AMP-binding protein [Nocardioides speluncae]|uniref:AMP-binding protein n=1 Tax=Nocardioides speluncae TaxID=2670337 RepID=UPI000D69D797|nr:AMP-binding protein [Nocardioides speluncae]
MTVEVDFSLLDVTRQVPVDDNDAYLRAALAWHFGAETGSAFWLRIAPTLGFDPLTEVTSYADLARFPNVLAELRTVPVADLVPRGYGTPPPVPQIFESGGTTGAPKRTVQLPDWIAQTIEWHTDDWTSSGYVRGRGLLGVMPSGPHGVGYFARLVSAGLGSVFHTVDLDPRWVKRLAAREAAAEVAAYVSHLVEQVGYVLQTQDVANLLTTPPLLQQIVRRDDLLKLVRSKIGYVVLSGASIDVDTLDLLRAMLPATTITMTYGSTMILSQTHTRPESPDSPAFESFVFDPRSPYVHFRVIDPATGEPVPYGERGQVVMNHISKGMFLPNNLERDTAIRVPGPPGQVGDSVTEIAPVAAFEGEPVIEGVY